MERLHAKNIGFFNDTVAHHYDWNKNNLRIIISYLLQQREPGGKVDTMISNQSVWELIKYGTLKGQIYLTLWGLYAVYIFLT